MLRYKAKIEDLEATLAQKGQVGIWLLPLLQMQTIQTDLPLDHPVHGPIQDTAWLSTVTFLKLCQNVQLSVSVPGVWLARV